MLAGEEQCLLRSVPFRRPPRPEVKAPDKGPWPERHKGNAFDARVVLDELLLVEVRDIGRLVAPRVSDCRGCHGVNAIHGAHPPSARHKRLHDPAAKVAGAPDEEDR